MTKPKTDRPLAALRRLAKRKGQIVLPAGCGFVLEAQTGGKKGRLNTLSATYYPSVLSALSALPDKPKARKR